MSLNSLKRHIMSFVQCRFVSPKQTLSGAHNKLLRVRSAAKHMLPHSFQAVKQSSVQEGT